MRKGESAKVRQISREHLTKKRFRGAFVRLSRLFAGLSLLSAATLAQPAPSQDRLADIWGDMPGYGAEAESSTPYQAQQASEILGIPAAILEEYVITAQSHWNFRSQSDGSNGGSTIQADAFQMLDPPGAYGLMTLWRHSSAARDVRSSTAFADSLFDGRQMVFRRGSYFVRLVAEQQASGLESTLAGLAVRLAEAIQEEDALPVTVINLPQAGLLKDSLRLYLGPAGLRRDPTFPEALLPLLEFGEGVELAAARFESGHTLFLVGYPTPALAKLAEQRLQSADALGDLRLKRSGVLVALATSSSVLEEVAYNPKVQWIKDKVITLQSEALSLYKILTSWVFFSLFYIACILVGGALVGLSRYVIHRRYPDFAARDDMVQLKLAD